MVWTCLTFIGSGQNHLARHSERGKKTRQTEERWEDNIREWTGLDFSRSKRAVENREKWRKLLVKSSVVPQRPLAEGLVKVKEMPPPPPPPRAFLVVRP